MRVAVRLGWWGAGFAGSQRQPGLRTVEGALIAALVETGVIADPRQAGFALSGRTDAGVHARAQVGALSTERPERLAGIVNRALPPDLWLSGTAPAPDGWHPRHGVASRTYRYFFADPDLDVEAMDRAAARVVGEYDVSRFCRAGQNDPIRRVLASRVFLGEAGPVYEVTGWSFLWRQVRGMATALERAGHGELDAEGVDSLLAGTCKRPVPPAPADRLVLWEVAAPFPFAPVEPAPRSRAFLRATGQGLRTRAGIADLLETG